MEFFITMMLYGPGLDFSFKILLLLIDI